MKILFFSQSNWSLPSISELIKEHEVVGIVTVTNGPKANGQILTFAEQMKIPVIEWGLLTKESGLAVFDECKAELGISFGFSFKISKEVFSSFPLGVLNVHFGKLPKYAGAAPLFWTINNQEPSVALSFHFINEHWDSGELIMEHEMPIFPGEPFGLLGARAASVSSERLKNILSRIDSIERKALEVNSEPKARPDEKDLTIDWRNKKANEIEALVNASNPSYGGAITYFRGSQIKILEVSPADVTIPGIFSPGSIVYADAANGIFVICGDYNFLRLNIIQFEGSILSGQKLAALGVKATEKLG